jgi:hypothetical protein
MGREESSGCTQGIKFDRKHSLNEFRVFFIFQNRCTGDQGGLRLEYFTVQFEERLGKISIRIKIDYG